MNSDALGLNAAGQVVGGSYTTGDAFHAFLYSGGTMIDLNNYSSGVGWVLGNAAAINDKGWIVGWGTSPSSGNLTRSS